MNYNPYSVELYQWTKKRSSAKSRMIIGIVFTALAYFIELVGVGVASAAADNETVYMVAGIIIIASLPFWAVGLPLLITGIVGLIKAKRQISRIVNEQRAAEAQYQNHGQPYQQPTYQQPAPQQQQYQQPPYQQPTYTQPIYQPPMYQQPVEQPQPAPEQPVDTNEEKQ